MSGGGDMSDFFLSYAHDDTKSASIVASLLQANGVTVWWDRSLVAGDRFHKVIEDEINKAKAVIVLWSRKSVQSDWVQGEAQTARELDKLVPVKIEECKLPIPYRAIHTPEIYKSKAELDDLARLLSEKYGSRSSSVATPAARATPITISSTSAASFFNDFKSQWKDYHEEFKQLQQLPIGKRFGLAFSWGYWRQMLGKYPMAMAATVLIGLGLNASMRQAANSQEDPNSVWLGFMVIGLGYFAYRWYRRSRGT